MENKENVFDTIADEHQENNEQPIPNNSSEYDYNNLPDTPVGDMKKYVRQNLDGKTVKILSAKLFEATTDDEEITALTNKDIRYKKPRFILTYDSKNDEGLNDREYLSGVIQFVQKDGSLSQPKFFNPSGENQISNLWRLVAAKKNIEPEDLSPREFMGFLNSGISVKLADTVVKYNKTEHHKNLPVEIL